MSEMGYNVFEECIPVVQLSIIMGAIAVDYHSKTSMEQLYAVETACNGVWKKSFGQQFVVRA